MKGFSIIIVTWNGLHHLKKFLPSVIKTKYPNFEIIVADNNSTDGSIEWIKKTYPEVKIAALNHNYGYTGGNNRALPFASKDILIFLNNDVEVTPNWLDAISDTFEKDDSIAIVQPKLKSYEDRDFFEYAGAAGGFIDKWGYPFCRGRVFDHLEKDEGQYDNVSEITWASGAAYAIKRNIFEKFEGFDEDFEFHMEEIDLSWRILNEGYKAVFTPDSTVYHLGGGSLPMGSKRKVYYNFRNNLIMLTKNLPKSKLLYTIFFRLVLDGIAALRSLFSGKLGEFASIFKAHVHFYLAFPKTMRKRKKLTEKRQKRILAPISIVWNFFILGNRTYRKIQP